MENKKLSFEETVELIKAAEEQDPNFQSLGEDRWKDYLEMLKDIKDYVKNNENAKIVQYDQPFRLAIGYRDANAKKFWFCLIADIRRGIKKDKPEEKDIVARALNSIEGKSALLEELNKRD